MTESNDVYSLPCGRCVLTTPDPSTMTADDVSEVEQWLSLVVRRLYRQHYATKRPADNPPAEQPTEADA